MLPSIGIIGGADGPTAIFVASAPGIDWVFVILAAIFLAGLFAWWHLRRRRKK